jgi:argininosuccinate lyase
VATDLRLHVREQCAVAVDSLSAFILELVARAVTERDTLLPAYTHRQRAQPISLAYWLAAYGAMFSRDAQLLVSALETADVLPLGVGAIAGSSLPIDRTITRDLLGFTGISLNGLDTVGDRDFALDYLYAAARTLTHAGRLSTDLIDFTTSEFGFARVSGDIAMGSSMMPQKRNPDVFELVRGKSGRAIGNLMGLLATVKGLPGGYNRDLQEDRAGILETGPLLNGSLAVLRLSLPHVTFDVERCRAAVEEGGTQATDLAEALVTQGVPFREAYKLIGALVAKAREQGVALAKVSLETAQALDPRLNAEVLARLDPATSVARKKSIGSTGPEAVAAQLEALATIAGTLQERSARVPRIDALFGKLKETAL